MIKMNVNKKHAHALINPPYIQNMVLHIKRIIVKTSENYTIETFIKNVHVYNIEENKKCVL